MKELQQRPKGNCLRDLALEFNLIIFIFEKGRILPVQGMAVLHTQFILL